MGPYCNFCGKRCYVPIPVGTSEKILKAYGTATIIATCRQGQDLEKVQTGFCYDDILRELNRTRPDAEKEHLDRIAMFIGGLRDAIDIYGEMYGPDRLRNASPLLKEDLDDLIEAIEDRLQEMKRPARGLFEVIHDAAAPFL